MTARTEQEIIEDLRRQGKTDWQIQSYLNGWRKPAPNKPEQKAPEGWELL